MIGNSAILHGSTLCSWSRISSALKIGVMEHLEMFVLNPVALPKMLRIRAIACVS